ncbi:peptidase C13 [Frateuria sp. Soil773]|uniref:C13 family peptidase n=1 Tax=Frateuria sp. Soil773 TaxID=1736407 RepID=UPI0006FD814B|nr:C13 family peptidase [Frateuria sp. Soil773]KRE99466.1 peptidase C13 [Frateuria sp. Soil773]
MRTALTTLLAFVAGVALAVLLLRAPVPQQGGHGPVAPPAPPAASTAAAPAPVPGDDTASDDWPPQAPTPEQVIYAQPQKLHEALAGLGPRVPGRPNLYLLAFAADGSEDVFRNEAEYAATLFTHRFGPGAHALVLENSPDALSTRPLASWSNLEAALDGLARVMQPEQDILLLYVTTHGSEDHTLLVDMDPLPLDQIGAQDLGAILAKRPFKWKVAVINACYSGGFVPPLRGPGTLVLTAARSDRSSFGCGSDSDATYFGRAWLVDALNRTPDFIEAFKLASREIGNWEQRDKLTPSEPQIDVGKGIAAQLARWREGLAIGAPVPFKPPRDSAP